MVPFAEHVRFEADTGEVEFEFVVRIVEASVGGRPLPEAWREGAGESPAPAGHATGLRVDPGALTRVSTRARCWPDDAAAGPRHHTVARAACCHRHVAGVRDRLAVAGAGHHRLR